MAGEAELVISAPGQTSVTVWATNIIDNIDKSVIIIPKFRAKTDMDNEVNPDTNLVNIGRLTQIISVQGILIDETTESAQVKKNNLLKIVKFERVVTMTWGTGSRAQTYVGDITKCAITETPGIIGAQASGYESEKNFAVQLTLQIGTSMLDK